MKKWEIISSKIVFNKPWFKVRQDKIKLPDSKITADYFVWEAPDICMIIPIAKTGKIIMTREYKHASNKIIFNFPAGVIEKNEKPKESALRELEEETGYVSKKIKLIGKINQDPSKKTGTFYLYLAEEAEPSGQKKFDELENIETLEVPYKKIVQLASSGKLCDATSLAALFLLKEKFPELFK